MRNNVRPLLIASLLATAGCSVLPREPIEPVSKEDMHLFNGKSGSPSMPVNELAGDTVVLDTDASAKSFILSRMDEGDPLPTFDVGPLSMQNVKISEALRLVASGRPISFSVARALDGTEAQGGTISAQDLSGSFDNLIRSLSDSMGFFYSYKGGVLHIKPDEQFVLSLPPFETSIAGINETLDGLGARNLKIDKTAYMATFRATKPVYERIAAYVNHLKETRSIVVYDTWIYEVQLNDSTEGGISWNKFTYTEPGSVSRGSVGVSGSGSQPTNGLGVSFVYNGSAFSLDLLVKFLKSQGTLHTLSQPKLAVLTGTKGQIKAGRKLTYISQVGQSTTAANTTATTATSSELQVGVDMTLTANVDEGTIYSDVKLKAEDLLQFNEFTALGTQLKLPDTSNREINTVIRSRPGDVILLGGITVNRDQDSDAGLPGMWRGIFTTSTSKKRERSEMIIVMRPRVISFKKG